MLKMERQGKQQWGFTLIEMMVVVTIISLLATMGLISYSSTTKNARDGKRKADLEQIRSALVLYRVDVGNYPASITWSTMSPIATYMSGSLPSDPKPAPYTQYSYTTAGGITFSVCAMLEVTSTSYCLVNP